MAEESKVDAISFRSVEQFPAWNFPVHFCDSFSSVGWSGGVVKVYGARIDPNINGNGSVNVVPNFQIVMPIEGFVRAALFFENTLNRLLKDKIVTQEQIDTIRTENAR